MTRLTPPRLHSCKGNGIVLAILVLVSATFSQAQAKPPACTSPTSTASEGIHHPVSPPAPDQLQATAAKASHDPTILASPEPANLGIGRYRIQAYADCTGNGGCYWADLEAQTQRAKAELDDLLAIHHIVSATQAEEQKLAIVLDIDETSLSSYCEEQREDYGFIPGMFNEWVVSPAASIPVPGTVRLFRRARAAGVSVFFLTGRPHEQTEATSRNLHAAGFVDWQGLILRDEAQRHLPTTEYKAAERAKLIARGYAIILNVGDQWSDLLGKPQAERSVKLPNPFYYLP